jgi:hypothetical protein
MLATELIKPTHQRIFDFIESQSLQAGDTGAYTSTYASVGFNGFAPLAVYYI